METLFLSIFSLNIFLKNIYNPGGLTDLTDLTVSYRFLQILTVYLQKM